jgi:hypothetical protein
MLLICPFQWVELETAQNDFEEEASSSVLECCDYRPGDRTVTDRVRCGSDLRQDSLSASKTCDSWVATLINSRNKAPRAAAISYVLATREAN